MPNSVIEITAQDVKFLSDLVDEAINASLVPNPSGGNVNESTTLSLVLRNKAWLFGQDHMKTVLESDCGLQYSYVHNELLTWAIGLLALNWTLEIFRKKAKVGHCYKHPLPCAKGRNFHESLYEDCIDSIQKLLAELKNSFDKQITELGQQSMKERSRTAN